MNFSVAEILMTGESFVIRRMRKMVVMAMLRCNDEALFHSVSWCWNHSLLIVQQNLIFLKGTTHNHNEEWREDKRIGDLTEFIYDSCLHIFYSLFQPSFSREEFFPLSPRLSVHETHNPRIVDPFLNLGSDVITACRSCRGLSDQRNTWPDEISLMSRRKILRFYLLKL